MNAVTCEKGESMDDTQHGQEKKKTMHDTKESTSEGMGESKTPGTRFNRAT
jgi:hypothetical protein